MVWRTLGQIRPSLPGPPFVVSEYQVDELLRVARDSGRVLIRVEVPDPPARGSLLAALGAALPFPDGFGANWDAWYDSFGDFVDGSTKAWLILVERAERLLHPTPALFAEMAYNLQQSHDEAIARRSGALVEFVFAGRW